LVFGLLGSAVRHLADRTFFAYFRSEIQNCDPMNNIKIDLEHIFGFIPEESLNSLQPEIDHHYASLWQKTGAGNDFLGWMDLPSAFDKDLFRRMEEDAARLRENSEIFVVIGIGGSYLGARAVIEALGHQFYDLMENRKYPYIIYAGHNLGEDYHAELLELLDKKDYSLAVISKSGTTTEPAIAFRILKNHLEKKYGKAEARKRIIAVTDKARGALKTLSDSEGYPTYVVPDDVGGRYSVLTPVGLLPIAMAGFDIRKLVEGAAEMESYSRQAKTIADNPVMTYAAARNALYRKGKTIEILVNYLPNLYYLTEWWKQLYGESEGKQGKGIFPAGAGFTTDLHSMGQYIQDGMRNIFETVLSVENSSKTLVIPRIKDDSDSLNYLAGKRIGYVNRMAEKGTLMAHVDGGVPNIRVSVPEINEYNLGQLIYFFELACGLSGYMLGVNPFDQPGVEAYKKNMFALLGKK
jgi:glucose-6-phosphate isomerase